MTRNEFANTKFYHGQKVLYKNEPRKVIRLDFDEDLIGLQTDDMLEIDWIRCENCEIYSERPERHSNPST